MKKFGIVVLSFLVSFSLISATFAADLFEKDVKYGVTKNDDVRQLQDFLYNEGFYKGPVTGNFYTLTRNALKKYQLANKITPANGLFNSATREKLNSALLAQENASEEVLGGDDIGYTADDEAARLAWVARMQNLQTEGQKIQQDLENIKNQNQILQQTINEQNNRINTIVSERTSETSSTPIISSPPILKKKATVSLYAYSNVFLVGRQIFREETKGFNSDWNRKNENLPISNENPKIVNFYVDFNKGIKSSLDLRLNTNNDEQTNDFTCVKSGNKFWEGYISNQNAGADVFSINDDSNKEISESFMGKTLRFGVACTNSDGTISEDYIDVFFTSELPKNW